MFPALNPINPILFSPWSVLHYPPTETLYAFLCLHVYCMACQYYPPSLDHSGCIWQRVQVMKLHITEFSPTYCHFISLRSRYSLQHPVLKRLQSVFFLYCQRPSFTLIQNYKQNYTERFLPLLPVNGSLLHGDRCTVGCERHIRILPMNQNAWWPITFGIKGSY
jgi:hypothetical protein